MNDEFRMEQRTVNQAGSSPNKPLIIIAFIFLSFIPLKPLAGCLRDCL